MNHNKEASMWTPEQFLEWLNAGRAVALPGERPLAEIPTAVNLSDKCFCARAWGVSVGLSDMPTPPDWTNEKREAFVKAIDGKVKTSFNLNKWIVFPPEAVQWIGSLALSNAGKDGPLEKFGLVRLRKIGPLDLPPLVVTEPEIEKDEEPVLV